MKADVKGSVNENAVATPSYVLTHALAVLGPNGENWIQGTDKVVKATCQWCAWTAIHHALFGGRTGVGLPTDEAVEKYVKHFGFDSMCDLYRWNDAPERTFPEVKAAFEKAIELAKAAEVQP